MDLSIIKLAPPSTALPLMSRTHVLERLRNDGDYKVSLLRAPAGYGKTSLLRMIYGNAIEAEQDPAWLTLDSADNDPARLLLGLRTALRLTGMAEHDNFSQLQHSHCTHLFLDEVERLGPAAVELLFSLILQGMPPQLSVFIGTRTLHQFSTARLKAKGLLRELDVQDLQFTHDETLNYIRQTKLDVPPDSLDLLQKASEGWPAAVELTALAWKRLQGRSQIALPALQNLHDLGEYLAEEVFESQPTSIKDFLVATAPLASFNAELADAARGASDSATLIAAIRSAGLPIQPLHGAWFRYHPLFAEHVAQQHRPAPALYLRAAEWLASHDHRRESFDYFVKANRLERATDILESIMAPLRSHGQIATVVCMADRLPRELIQARPALTAAVIAGMVYSGRYRELKEWLDVCRHISAQPYADPLYGEVLRAVAPSQAFLHGDFEEATRLIASNWDQQQQAHVLERVTLTYIKLYSCLWRGDLDAANALMVTARRDCSLSNSLMGIGNIHFLQAYLDAIQGRLREADEELMALERVASQYQDDIPPTLLYLFGSGLMMMLKYELNQLDAINLRLQSADGFTQFGLPWESHMGIVLIQSRMIALQQDTAAARLWLRSQIIGAGRPHPLPAVALQVLESELARLAVQTGDTDALAGFARHLGDGQGLEQYLVPCQEIDGGGIAQARLQMAGGQAQAACARLQQLLEHALQHRRLWRATRLQLLLALALDRAGQARESEQMLVTAVTQGAQLGVIRSFLDEGEAALTLLQRLQGKARHLLSPAAMSHLDHLLALQAAPAASAAPLEELSQTETALLTMVAHGKTNKEIGDALFLSVNTVKWHMGQIFRKLGASNRSQAVFSARQAGLLPKQ